MEWTGELLVFTACVTAEGELRELPDRSGDRPGERLLAAEVPGGSSRREPCPAGPSHRHPGPENLEGGDDRFEGPELGRAVTYPHDEGRTAGLRLAPPLSRDDTHFARGR